MRKVEVIHHIVNENGFGGMGVLATHTEGDSFIRLTTEPCSKADQYSKKIAVAVLRSNYDDGAFIRIPVSKQRGVTHRELRDVVIELFS
jgi:hypothetical protein